MMDYFAALRPMIGRTVMPVPQERYCKSCDSVKPLIEFYLNGRVSQSGEPRRSYRCKQCDIKRIASSRRG